MKNQFLKFIFLMFPLCLFAEQAERLEEPAEYAPCYKEYLLELELSPFNSHYKNIGILPMPAGAEDLITLQRACIKISDFYLYPLDLQNYGSGFVGICGRLGKTILIDLPIANLILLTQHEYFGHGARLRDYGIPQGYRFEPPIPYGSGDGATCFPSIDFLALSLQEQQGVIIGGFEASEVLARKLVKKSLSCRSWDYREGLLYLFTYHDETDYIMNLEFVDEDQVGHDIKSYIETLNTIYGKEVLKENRLRTTAYINLLDPMTYISYSSLLRYWWNGETTTRIPMLHCGPVHFLPGARLTLAPYGPEYGIYSYFTCRDTVGSTYMRYGDTDKQKSFACGFEADTLWKIYNVRIGMRVDLWEQPSSKKNWLPSKTDFGMLWGGRLSRKISENFSLICEFGAKSRGFVIGEPLNSNIYIRAGIGFNKF